MTSAPVTLPHWDMTVVYPGLDSREFQQGFQALVQDIQELVLLFGNHRIGLREPASVDLDLVQTFETVIQRYNAVLEKTATMSAYIYSFVSTDSRDTLAQAKLSELQANTVHLSQLDTRFIAWLGSLDVEALIEQSEVAREHAFALRQAKVESAHLMTPAEESLAAELNLTGGGAWTKLHGNVTSQLMVQVEGEAEELPMSRVRNLAFDPDRDVRRRAYEAELNAWSGVALPLAGALNSIKGQVNTLTTRRGWESALEASLFDNSIDRQTLDAMLGAARESFPDFRRYLRAKARLLGLPALAWYDLFAPVSAEERTWEYDEAAGFIIEQFGSYSDKMGEFAARAFRERWIDAEPRPGKRDGAYCMSLRGDESRVFANYKPTFGGVRTLAHELGHAYHNLTKAHRTAMQRRTPMTLAETASIFCETVIRQAGLERCSEEERVMLLQSSLEASCQVVVDITSRLIFEQSVFKDRRERELSIDEINDLMLAAQRETYGDGLDGDALHPYMWAVKPHYYSSGFSFYNYPYMFGLLFGLGLYARYQEDSEAFKTGYDDLLSSTGLADAATLAARFGIDLRAPNFWRASLDTIRREVDQFEAAVGSRAAVTTGN